MKKILLTICCSLALFITACGVKEVTYDSVGTNGKETIDFLIDHKNDWWDTNVHSIFKATYEGQPAILVRYLDKQDNTATYVWEKAYTYDISSNSMKCVQSQYKAMKSYSYDKKKDELTSSSLIKGNWENSTDVRNELAKILYPKK